MGSQRHVTSIRAALSKGLFVLMIAAGLLVLVMGHQDLYRLFQSEGEAVRVNWRFVGPLLGWCAIASLLALVHANAIVAAARARQAPAFLHAAFVALIAIGIGVFANLISHRRAARWDFTHEASHALSERTKTVLDSLEETIEIDVLVTPENPWFTTVSAMCDGFEAAAHGKVKVTYLHPAVDPARARSRLIARGISPDDLADTRLMVVAQAEAPAGKARPRSRLVPLSELVYTVDSQGPAAQGPAAHGADPARTGPAGTGPVHDPGAYRFRGEEALTRAVLAVSRPNAPVVAFTTGHRELDRAGASANRSLSGWVRALGALDYRVEELRFDAGRATPLIPSAISVLVIAGARTPFAPSELEALRGWLERGGRLLVLSEPYLATDPGDAAPLIESNRLGFVLEGYGIILEPRMLRDSEHQLPLSPWAFEAPLYGGRAARHPITEPLARRKMWLRLTGARPLRLVTGRGRTGSDEVAPVPIAVALPSAVAIGGVAGDDAAGALGGAGREAPFVLAAAARRTEAGGRESRVFVLGDATAATDLLATEGARAGNLSLLVNAVGWLAEAEAKVSISAKTPRVMQIHLTADQARRLWLLCLVELPGVFVLLGALVWFNRR